MKKLTAEQRARKTEINRAYRARMTPEKKARRAAIKRAYRVRMTPEQKACRAAVERARLAQMTPQQKAHKAKTKRAWHTNNLPRTLCTQARHNAKEAGVPFDLTPVDIVVPERCSVFGLILQVGKGYSGPASPTLDRIDASRGYVRGNVAVISQYANSRKGRATAAQHRRIAEWMDSVTGAAPSDQAGGKL